MALIVAFLGFLLTVPMVKGSFVPLIDIAVQCNEHIAYGLLQGENPLHFTHLTCGWKLLELLLEAALFPLFDG